MLQFEEHDGHYFVAETSFANYIICAPDSAMYTEEFGKTLCGHYDVYIHILPNAPNVTPTYYIGSFPSFDIAKLYCYNFHVKPYPTEIDFTLTFHDEISE